MKDFVVLFEGQFGRKVAEQITRSVPEARTFSLVDSQDRLDELAGGAEFVCVALWRRYLRECEALDAACARQQTPWSSAFLDGAKLIIGPVISPGGGPCYACYRKRLMTHVAMPERELSLDEAYASDPTLGVGGFVPSSVAMAAAALLIDRKEHAGAAGRIRQIDLLNCNVEETRVVRVHGCERCSRARKPSERYIDRLIPAVKEILS